MNEVTTIAQGSALDIAEGKDLATYFAKPDALADLLSRIETEVRSHAPDLTTAKGRDAIKSLAAKVARSKTALDAAGKTLNEDHRAAINAVDAERRKVRDRLDALKLEARAPLTEWEEAEEARKARLTERLAALDAGRADAHCPRQQIADVLDEIKNTEIGEDWGEFREEARIARDRAVRDLTANLEIARQREAEQAELEQLRREKAEREEADRKRREAEEAEARRIAAEKSEADRQERIEREKAEAAHRAAREAEDRAAREAKEAEERHQRELAEAKAREERAAQAERDRIEAERRAEEEARAKREANKRHRAKIRGEIVEALSAMRGKATPEAIADALMAGEIPHTEVRI